MSPETIRCGHCQDGPYKSSVVHPESNCQVGGLIDGYWFCGWCLEYGCKDQTDAETERWDALIERAQQNDSSRVIQCS